MRIHGCRSLQQHGNSNRKRSKPVNGRFLIELDGASAKREDIAATSKMVAALLPVLWWERNRLRDCSMVTSVAKDSPDGQNWLIKPSNSTCFLSVCKAGVAVFSSKSRSPDIQLYLTHIDENRNDSRPIYIDNVKAAKRAANIPEFVNIPSDGLQQIDVPATDFYRVMDEVLALQNKGDRIGALTKWQQALAMAPDDARVNNSTGIALALAGKSEEAIAKLQKAVQSNPEFAEAYFNLAVAPMNTKHLDEAIDTWLNAVRIRQHFA